jgi:hypothetical protein
MPMRKAGFICPVLYHIRNAVAAVRLLFFSGVLRGTDRPADRLKAACGKLATAGRREWTRGQTAPGLIHLQI